VGWETVACWSTKSGNISETIKVQGLGLVIKWHGQDQGRHFAQALSAFGS